MSEKASRRRWGRSWALKKSARQWRGCRGEKMWAHRALTGGCTSAAVGSRRVWLPHQCSSGRYLPEVTSDFSGSHGYLNLLIFHSLTRAVLLLLTVSSMNSRISSGDSFLWSFFWFSDSAPFSAHRSPFRSAIPGLSRPLPTSLYHLHWPFYPYDFPWDLNSPLALPRFLALLMDPSAMIIPSLCLPVLCTVHGSEYRFVRNVSANYRGCKGRSG